MTVTYADSTTSEAAVVRGSNNPVVAVRTAADDGLLAYRGFSAGAGFEVEVAGRVMMIPEGAVPEMVRRLRMLDELRREGRPVTLTELRDDGTFVLDVGVRVAVAGVDLRDWLRGYRAAAVGAGQEHEGEDHLDPEIRQVLVAPGLNDQCRMVLLGLMYGGRERVSADTLRERMGQRGKPPTKKTVVDALGFGNNLSPDLADWMIETFGLRWSLGGKCVHIDSGKPARVLPEMPGVVRLRMILAASDAGWLRYVGTKSVNWARKARTYELTVGRQLHMVSRDSLRPWLSGLAAFHGVAEVPGERAGRQGPGRQSRP